MLMVPWSLRFKEFDADGAAAPPERAKSLLLNLPVSTAICTTTTPPFAAAACRTPQTRTVFPKRRRHGTAQEQRALLGIGVSHTNHTRALSCLRSGEVESARNIKLGALGAL